MPRIGSVMQLTRRLTIDLGGEEKIRLEYSPQKMTARVMDHDEDALEDDDLDGGEEAALAFARDFCDVITDWDATGPVPTIDRPDAAMGSIVGEDEPIPLDPEIVRYVYMPALVGIWRRVNEDATADPTKKPSGLPKRGSNRRSTR